MIKIGTRGSKLALWQAYYVSDALKKNGHDTEIVIIETKGDKILDRSLSKIGSKGVFTEELEQSLRDGTIDIAVHSAKDMQSTIPEDTEIIAFTEREKVNDVVISVKGKQDLSEEGIRIATSSTRRRAQVRKCYPHAELVEVRGNLQTRIKKLEEGIADVLLLAYAGVHRMEYDQLISEELSIDAFIPSVGQGSVAIQSAKHLNEDVKEAVKDAVNHEPTSACLRAERALFRELDGGCSVPVFGNAVIDGTSLTLTGGVISLDGTNEIKDQVTGDIACAEFVGTELAQRLDIKGAKQLLKEIREQINN